MKKLSKYSYLKKYNVNSFNMSLAICGVLFASAFSLYISEGPKKHSKELRSPASGPIVVNSLAADVSTSQHRLSILRSDLGKILPPNASKDDRILALATVVLAGDLDDLLIRSNRFESVPDYRVNHVLRAFVAHNRLSANESAEDVYDRVLQHWRQSCESRIAAGRGCDFLFNFDTASWYRGIPTTHQILNSSHISHITPELIQMIHSHSIEKTVSDLTQTGRYAIVVGGKNYQLSVSTDKSLAELKELATSLWQKIYTDQHFLVIDQDFIRERYASDIRRMKTEIENGEESLYLQLGPQKTPLFIDFKNETDSIEQDLVEEIRKAHSLSFFGQKDLVVLARSEVRREIREHRWDGFSMRLPEAPPTLNAFREKLREHLNTIYLARTRRSMMQARLSQNIRPSDQFVSPRDMLDHLAQFPALQKTAEFITLNIPLNQNLSNEDIHNNALEVAQNLNEVTPSNAVDLFKKAAARISDNLNIDIKPEKHSYSGVLSQSIPAPDTALQLQMYQIVFQENLSGNDDNFRLVYFVDTENAALSFIFPTHISDSEEIAIRDFQKHGIDQDRLQKEIEQLRFSQLYAKSVDSILDQLHISIRDRDWFFDGGNFVQDDRAQIRSIILQSIERLENRAPGAGWSHFLDGVYRSPLTPKDLRPLQKSSPQRRGFLGLSPASRGR